MESLRNPEYDGSMGIFEGYGEFDPDTEYSKAMDRTHTIDSILSLNPVLKREYLNTLNTDALHDLEESILDTRHSS
jgi:hypothetical protein